MRSVGVTKAGPGEPWVAQQRVSTWTEKGNAYLESATQPTARSGSTNSGRWRRAPLGVGRARHFEAGRGPQQRERREPAAATRRDAHAQHKPRCHRGAAVRGGRERERERETNVSASLGMFWCHRVMRIRRIHLPHMGCLDSRIRLARAPEIKRSQGQVTGQGGLGFVSDFGRTGRRAGWVRDGTLI